MFKSLFKEKAVGTPWTRPGKTHVAFLRSQTHIDAHEQRITSVKLSTGTYRLCTHKEDAAGSTRIALIRKEDGTTENIEYTNRYEFSPSEITDDGTVTIHGMHEDAELLWDGTKDDVLFSGTNKQYADFSATPDSIADKMKALLGKPTYQSV